MSEELKKINNQELEVVTGGEGRIVNTGKTDLDAVIRSGAGFANPQIMSVTNGTWVNTTGYSIQADGRTWWQIKAPVNGWLAGGMIGLPDRY